MKYAVTLWFFICFFTLFSMNAYSTTIVSTTSAEATGSFDESKIYSSSKTDGDSDNVSKKVMIYSNEVHSISGKIKLEDYFNVTLSDNSTDFLYATQDINYQADNDNSTGIITGVERIGIGVYNYNCKDNGFFTIATGIGFNTYSLVFHTDADVKLGDKPSLSYNISSNGASYGTDSTPFGAIKTGIEATISTSGDDDEQYSEHYNISGAYKMSKSIKFAR
jgi:hypothetical protein